MDARTKPNQPILSPPSDERLDKEFSKKRSESPRADMSGAPTIGSQGAGRPLGVYLQGKCSTSMVPLLHLRPLYIFQRVCLIVSSEKIKALFFVFFI